LSFDVLGGFDCLQNYLRSDRVNPFFETIRLSTPAAVFSSRTLKYNKVASYSLRHPSFLGGHAADSPAGIKLRSSAYSHRRYLLSSILETCGASEYGDMAQYVAEIVRTFQTGA
jgi:hypothetical protein